MSTVTETTDPGLQPPPPPELLQDRSPGIGAFGAVGTVGLFVIIVIVAFVLKLVGLIAGLVVGVVLLIALTMTVLRDSEGRTRGGVVLSGLRWKRGERDGTNAYNSGPLTPLGTYKLPGLLAESELTEHVDVTGRPYAFVRVPSTSTVSVVIEAFPDGVGMLDDAEIKQLKGQYAELLNQAALIAPAVQMQVVFESYPESQHRMRKRLDGQIADTASAVSRKLIKALAGEARQAANVRAYVVLTLNEFYAGRKRTVEETAKWLAPKLPHFVELVTKSGGGHSVPLTGQQVCEVIRAAYDPACADALAEAAANDDPVVMRWDSIGPPAANNDRDRYRHSSGQSICWSMVEHHGAVSTPKIGTLLQPHEDIPVKRVTIIYKLRNPAAAVAVAIRDERSAGFHGAKEKATARDRKRERRAVTNADQESQGAALLDVSIIVTATVFTDEQVAEAETAAAQLGPGARLALRREDNDHAAAFALGLPLGLVASRFSRVPSAIRDGVSG